MKDKIIIDLETAMILADEHNKIAILKLPEGASVYYADLKSAEDYLGKEYPLQKSNPE